MAGPVAWVAAGPDSGRPPSDRTVRLDTARLRLPPSPGPRWPARPLREGRPSPPAEATPPPDPSPIDCRLSTVDWSTRHYALGSRDGPRAGQAAGPHRLGPGRLLVALGAAASPPPGSCAMPAPSRPARRYSTWRPGTATSRWPAREEGASVVASDLSPVMVERGTRAAAAEGFDVEWVEADAEELPFEDGRFDCVGSVFGAMFAPRPRRRGAGAVPRRAAGQHRRDGGLDARAASRRSCSRIGRKYAPAAPSAPLIEDWGVRGDRAGALRRPRRTR